MTPFITAFAAVCLPAGIALAAQFVHDSGTHKWKTAVSGVAGSTKEHLVSSSRGVHRIVGYEYQDDPDTFVIYESPLDPNNSNSTRAGEVNALSWRSASGSLKDVNIGSERAGTAIQACISNEKIKGLRLWGKTVRSDGTLGTNETMDEFKRPNCGNNEWDTKISCGSAKIITGLRFHVDNANKGFSGITVRCGKIK